MTNTNTTLRTTLGALAALAVALVATFSPVALAAVADFYKAPALKSARVRSVGGGVCMVEIQQCADPKAANAAELAAQGLGAVCATVKMHVPCSHFLAAIDDPAACVVSSSAPAGWPALGLDCPEGGAP